MNVATFSASHDARRADYVRQLKAALVSCKQRMKEAHRRADVEAYQALQVQLHSLERQLERATRGVYDTNAPSD